MFCSLVDHSLLLKDVWFGVMVRCDEKAKILSQLNDTNAVQKWSFSKCGFSTGLVSKINGKHVHGNIIVLFIQKIARGASCRPPGGPRVAPQYVRFKICCFSLLNELSTIYL